MLEIEKKQTIRQTFEALADLVTDDLLKILIEAGKDRKTWQLAKSQPDVFLKTKDFTLPSGIHIGFEEKDFPSLKVQATPVPTKNKKLKCVAVYSPKIDKYGNLYAFVSGYICHFE